MTVYAEENGVFKFHGPRGVTTVVAAGLVSAGLLVGCAKKDDARATPAAPEAKAPSISQAAPATAGTASIAGKVSFVGEAPVASALDLNADPICAGTHDSPVMGQDAIVGADGGLKNVFVYVQSGASGDYEAPDAEVVLDQKGCVYEPHAVALQVGQTLNLLNSDSTTHNVHALPEENKPFNTSMPIPGMVIPKTFDETEIFKVKCDVHPWMSSYIGVFDNPYFAIMGADGSFKLSGLPAGTYTVAARHEMYGEQLLEVTVGDGEAGEAAFSWGG